MNVGVGKAQIPNTYLPAADNDYCFKLNPTNLIIQYINKLIVFSPICFGFVSIIFLATKHFSYW